MMGKVFDDAARSFVEFSQESMGYLAEDPVAAQLTHDVMDFISAVEDERERRRSAEDISIGQYSDIPLDHTASKVLLAGMSLLLGRMSVNEERIDACDHFKRFARAAKLTGTGEGS